MKLHSILLSGLLLCPSFLSAHPDKIEHNLLMHFATGVHPIDNPTWPDLTHSFDARVHGAPVLTNIGPAQALLLNGYTDWLEAAPDRQTASPALPTREFSVSAWVVLQDTTQYGGICGFLQDNGDFEKGWLLGYNNQSFNFILSTTGADDGNGKLTTLNAEIPLEKERWHHVAATYDGVTMRLFVNGKPAGQSTRQSGDILYPDQGRLAIGGYVDDNEQYLMEGGLFDTFELTKP